MALKGTNKMRTFIEGLQGSGEERLLGGGECKG